MLELNENQIACLYSWIDSARFSRPKRNLTRDFSDGVACAELIHNFIPKLVDLHNYSPASSSSQKIYNWHTLNNKVFKKLGYSTSPDIITCVVHMRPGYIEYLLWDLKQRIDDYRGTQYSKKAPSPEIHHDNHNQMHVGQPEEQKPQYVTYAPGNPVVKLAVPRASPAFHPEKEMQETIRLLQLKVEKMNELLELKTQKLERLSLSK